MCVETVSCQIKSITASFSQASSEFHVLGGHETSQASCGNKSQYKRQHLKEKQQHHQLVDVFMTALES